ncbi:MAG: aminoacyl-tRNA deacylase [Anaerolineae bacterium]|nr:aminoacyl-tRNA deacylase [Anaerolineae bacterium]
MATKLNAARLLRQRRIPFTLLRYDRGDFHDAEAVAGLLGVPAALVYKTLVLEAAAGGKPVLALIAADRALDLKRLAALSGQRKLRLAARDRAEELTGMQIGGISALALAHRRWPVWLDEAAREQEELLLSAGERGQQLRLATTLLIQLTGARVAAISRSPD